MRLDEYKDLNTHLKNKSFPFRFSIHRQWLWFNAHNTLILCPPWKVKKFTSCIRCVYDASHLSMTFLVIEKERLYASPLTCQCQWILTFHFQVFGCFFFVRLSLCVILRTSRFHLISYLLNFVVIFLSSSLFHFLSVFLFLLYTSPSISTLYLSYTFCLFQSVPCRSLVYLFHSPYMQNGSATNGLIKMGKTKNTNQNTTSQIRRAWYTWIYSWEQP